MAADWCLRTQGNGTETYLKQHWRSFPNLPVSGGWASWSGAGASSTTRSWSSLSAPEERGRRQSADPQCHLKSRVEHLSPELSRSWQVQNLSSDNCGGVGGGLTHDLRQGVTLQVQQDAPGLQAGPELKQAVEGQRGDVGLAPSFSSFLHFLLELHPPAKTKENPFAVISSHPSVETYLPVRRCLPGRLFPL